MLKKFFWSFYKATQRFFSCIDFYLVIERNKEKKFRKGLNLNVAAGNYVIDGFISLDFYSSHYYSSKSNFDQKRVHYDLRSDYIPYGDNEVDNIYISHAIEHIEKEYVKKFFLESFRVLKTHGVLRVVCPDAEFLYEVSLFDNQYWAWREPFMRDKNKCRCDVEKLNQSDYLIRELATPKLKFYNNRIESLKIDSLNLENVSYLELIKRLNKDLTFRPDYPGDHICSWDFAMLKELGKESGFSRVIRSKPRGSISREMQGPDFDKTAPQTSLYVDFLK